MRVLPTAAVVAAALLALTGCGSQAAEETASPSITVAPTTTAPPPPSPTATASPASPAPETEVQTAAPVETGGGAPADQCSDDALGVQIVPAAGGGGAGSESYDVLFTNTGGSACALRGAPGVSVVGDGNGTQLGKPADRIRSGVRTVRLAVGKTAAAPLQVVHIGTDGGPLDGCTVQKGDGYRVFAPHSKQAVLVDDATAVACVRGPSFMTVGPVVPFAG